MRIITYEVARRFAEDFESIITVVCKWHEPKNKFMAFIEGYGVTETRESMCEECQRRIK